MGKETVVLLKCYYYYLESVVVVQVDTGTGHFVYRSTDAGHLPCRSLHLGPGLPTLQAGGCEAAAALLPAEAVTPGPAWRRYARLAAADPRVASYLAARRSPALATHLQLPFLRQFALTEGTQGYSGDIQTQTMDQSR